MFNRNIITGRKEVVAKVMFLLMSVILSTGGCLPQCMLGFHPREQNPLGADTPKEQTPPRVDTLLGADISPSRQHPPEQTPPRADTPTPREQTPQEQTPPGAYTPRADPPGSRPPRSRHPPPPEQTPPPGIWLISGRFASYWNAFLFERVLHNLPCYSVILLIYSYFVCF